MNLLTISIVLYKNDIKVLKKTIESVTKIQHPYILYLVDNSPTPIFKELECSQNAIYIHMPSNPGFGAAHNIAIKKSIEKKSSYHLVLNPDIFFDSGTIENIIKFMDSNKNIGHLMPKILYPDNSFQYLCKNNPTFFDLFIRGFIPNFAKKYFKKRLDKYEKRDSNFNEIIFDIPYLSGCFMFFRTSFLKKVGFFDENIFMYLEDADITRRFLKFSNTVYYPMVTVYHHFAGLTHKKLKFKIITIQSAITYFKKWGWF